MRGDADADEQGTLGMLVRQDALVGASAWMTMQGSGLGRAQDSHGFPSATQHASAGCTTVRLPFHGLGHQTVQPDTCGHTCIIIARLSLTGAANAIRCF